jgi:hypothetical protein
MQQYIIIEEKDLHKFIQLVNKQLAEGFQCVGGVAVSTIYIQAMIKIE